MVLLGRDQLGVQMQTHPVERGDQVTVIGGQVDGLEEHQN